MKVLGSKLKKSKVQGWSIYVSNHDLIEWNLEATQALMWFHQRVGVNWQISRFVQTNGSLNLSSSTNFTRISSPFATKSISKTENQKPKGKWNKKLNQKPLSNTLLALGSSPANSLAIFSVCIHKNAENLFSLVQDFGLGILANNK